MNIAALRLLLRRWFLAGEERALGECLTGLRAALTGSPAIVKALGQAEIDDAREDLLIKLLDRESGALRSAESPLAFARASLRRALIDRLRLQLRRGAVNLDPLFDPAHAEVASPLDAAMIAERARQVSVALQRLTSEQRLAIVLTTFAERTPANDRRGLRGLSLTEPLPTGSLTVDTASAVLFGVPESESDELRRQRIDRFHKLQQRALAALRRQLDEAEEP